MFTDMKTRINIEKLKPILVGFCIPLFALVSILIFNPDPLLWWFTDSSHFETTHGKIIASSISLDGSASMNALGWHFEILYEYAVDKKVYTSDKVIYSSTGSSDKNYALNYVNKYPVGKEITVYYDPNHPEKSVLEPLVRDYQLIYMFIGFAILGLFIASLSIFIK